MGIRFSCDGCDQMLPEGTQPVEVGTVLKRQYCETCAPAANSYMDDVSLEHTVISRQWNVKLAEIRQRYKASGDASVVDTGPLKLLPDAD